MRTPFQFASKWIREAALWVLSLAVLTPFGTPILAAELGRAKPVSAPATKEAAPAWTELVAADSQDVAGVWLCGPHPRAGGDCYVISHGMGGTAPGDRFHRLAAAIRAELPRSSVIRIDWSERASSPVGGLPNPWKIARNIDLVGDHGAQVLAANGVDPAHAILIGESFGNWVSARIAQRLGGVHGILALNPASEAGGYAPPDLRRLSEQSWSFHTRSVFDTTLAIADNDFWLETPPEASPFAQHVAGINWLARRVEAKDLTWLSMDRQFPQREQDRFQGTVSIDGEFTLEGTGVDNACGGPTMGSALPCPVHAR